MKHIDIKSLLDAVKDVEVQEARTALEAYGGRCTFDPDNRPCVEFYGGNGPASGDVSRIRFSQDRKEIILDVVDDTTDGVSFVVHASDLYPGSLLHVVDYM